MKNSSPPVWRCACNLREGILKGFALILLMANLPFGGSVMATSQDAPKIDVWIMGSPQKVVGKSWPRRSNGDLLDMATIEHPAKYVVHLPSGKTMHLQGKTGTIQTDDDVVTLVSILPLNNVLPRQEALNRCLETLQQLGVKDEKLLQKLATWKAKLPEAKPAIEFRGRTSLDEQTSLGVEINAHSSGRGWFLVFEIARKPGSHEVNHADEM